MVTRSRFLPILVGMLLMLTASCDSTSSDPNPPEETFDRVEMLEHFGRNLIIPSYEALAAAVAELDASASAFAADPTEAGLTAVRADLKAARRAWQEASLYQFGPAEAQTLRAKLNTYPVDEDKIEGNVDSGSYTLGTIDNRAAVGFPALDYLFHGSADDDQAVLALFMDASDAANRRAYVQDNVAFVKEAVDATLAGWQANGDDYIGTFLSAEKAGTDVGSSLGMLINALVLHYERFVRDGKIGIPAGVRSAGIPRPTSTEAYYGGYSAELAVANVRAVQRLFVGNGLDGSPGTGLDDNLTALQAEQLAAEIETEMQDAIAALEALDDPLSAQIETDNEPVLTAFQEMQDVVVLLKADMTSVLGITITFQDNDGD